MSRSPKRSAAALFASSCAASLTAHAQTAPNAAEQALADQAASQLIINKAKDESAFEFSYAAPGSPVLPLIGVEAGQITRSESLRKFGIAFLNNLGSSGTSPALAVDFAPFWAFSSQSMSLAEYRDPANDLGRIAARTKMGLAGSLGDKAAGRPSSYVASLSTSLLDDHDALDDTTFSACVRDGELARAILEVHNTEIDDETLDGVAAFDKALELFQKKQPGLIDKAYAACVTRQSKALASKPSLDVGVGIRFRGEPGRVSNLDNSGTVFWGTFATGVMGGGEASAPRSGPLASLRARGVVHARYTLREDVVNAAFALQGRRNSGMIVAGIESAPPIDPKKTERLRWNVQAGWNRQNAVLPTEVDKNYWRYQAIVSLRISDGLWANGTLGRISGKGVNADTKALLSFTFTPPSKASKLTDYYNSRDK